MSCQDDNDTHKAFASILETFFRNYKGNEDDRIFQNISHVINQYTEDNKNNCAYAAELTLLFHENRPHIGFNERVEHFECIEPLYNRWPESRKIASAYISFLGDIAASSIGAHAPAYSDSYITKFEKLLNLEKSTDYVIKKAFIPVLIKAIERANSVHDWKRSTFLEDFFLKEVMEQCGDELALDCISKFDSVIISLTKQRADLVQAVTSEPISESKQLTIQEIDQKLEKEIVFFFDMLLIVTPILLSTLFGHMLANSQWLQRTCSSMNVCLIMNCCSSICYVSCRKSTPCTTTPTLAAF